MPFIICPNLPILMSHPSSNSLNTFLTSFHFLQSSHFASPHSRKSTLSLRTSPLQMLSSWTSPSPMVPKFLFSNLPNLHFDLLRVASTCRFKHRYLHLCSIVVDVVTPMPYNKMFTCETILSLWSSLHCLNYKFEHHKRELNWMSES